MAYATQQDMVDRFGERELVQLTDRANPPTGTVDATVLGKALIDAEAMINGYVASRYSLPLAETPQQIVRVTCDLARFFLDKLPTEEIKLRYDQALAWLRDVSAGRVSLGTVAPQTPPASNGGAAIVGGRRVFNAETLKDF